MPYFSLGAVMALVGCLLSSNAQASIQCNPVQGDEEAFEQCYVFDGTTGEFPEAGPTADRTGNLYITTFGSLGGGAPSKHCSKSCGSADSLQQSDSEIKVLHSFKPGEGAGSFPASELIEQKGHVIYGTAEYGPGTGCGGLGCGTVFQIMKSPVPGKLQTQGIAGFCLKIHCADGAFPRPGLVADGAGAYPSLYGMATLGGTGDGFLCGSNLGGCGVVYELTYDGNQYTKNILYSFCSKVEQSLCVDGAVPLGRLWRDKTGVLYGTTQFGGANGQGTVFQLTPPSGNGAWTESVVYSFCSEDQSCSDGAVPEAGVIQDEAGNLYGTTVSGGVPCESDMVRGCGVVFQLAPIGGTWSESVLHRFAGLKSGDGAFPQGPLVMDEKGNIYGTTVQGGTGKFCSKDHVHLGCGTVFAFSADHNYNVIHFFGIGTDHPNADGAHPEGALLLQDSDQHLYGSTRVGGDGYGTIYRLDLPLSISISRTP